MIPHGVEVFVGAEPVDLRWGFDRLTGVVAERLGRQVRSRALFVFFGRRRTAVKVLYFDGQGLCVLYKRLDAGTYPPLPPLAPGQHALRLTDDQLAVLLQGIEVPGSRAPRKRETRH
jgi:transposase